MRLVRDTAPMHLDEIIADIDAAHAQGPGRGPRPLRRPLDLRRRRRTDAPPRCARHPYEVVPGVPAFAGAAARLATELTLPEISQTIILTRTGGKASPMPPRETLEILGQTGATLAIHLSIRNLAYVETALTPHYGADCPVIIIYRATWPDEEIIVTTLAEMRSRVREEKITRTALDLRRPRLRRDKAPREPSLYDHHFAMCCATREEEVEGRVMSSGRARRLPPPR